MVGGGGGDEAALGELGGGGGDLGVGEGEHLTDSNVCQTVRAVLYSAVLK